MIVYDRCARVTQTSSHLVKDKSKTIMLHLRVSFPKTCRPGACESQIYWLQNTRTYKRGTERAKLHALIWSINSLYQII